MSKLLLALLLAGGVVLFASGFLVWEKKKTIGGERDEHGCLIAAGYRWCEPKRKCLREWEEPCGEPSPAEEPSPGERSPAEAEEGSPQSIVETFCEKFFRSAPPHLDEAAVMQAIGLLSSRARNVISTKGPSPTGALTQFAGVQDIPDQGFTVDNVSESGNTATVVTTWNYSSGPVTKTFDLVKENDTWKIDSIE